MIIQHRVHRRETEFHKAMSFSKATGFSQIRFSVYSYKRPDLSRISAQPFLFSGLGISIWMPPSSYTISLPNFPTSSLSPYSEMTLPFDTLIWSLTSPFHQFFISFFSPFCTSHPPYLALWTSHWIYCKCNPLVLLLQFSLLTSTYTVPCGSLKTLPWLHIWICSLLHM